MRQGLLNQRSPWCEAAGGHHSMLQRRLRIGYPRAARLLDQLEEAGVVGPSQGGGREREILPYDEDGDDGS
jgi:S-DNA-T family DNA segregation ATPase FtsK/SpoIIIE